jgi:ketol-acid reductoisomerase
MFRRSIHSLNFKHTRGLVNQFRYFNGIDESIYVADNKSKWLLKDYFEGIEKIGIIGWGSQAPAQAQNLRDSLNSINLDIPIQIGLRENSNSTKKAEELNFKVDSVENTLSTSDFNILLTSDASQAENYQHFFSYLKPGSTLGLSHGFLLGHLKNMEEDFPENNIIMVAPKGMGPSVRKLYLEGNGINSSYAVYKAVDKRALNLALGWAIGIGSPQIFETTMDQEYVSDIFGERAILLGGIHGIVEYLFRLYNKDLPYYDSYNRSVTYLVGDLSQNISKNGLLSVYIGMNDEDKQIFEEYYSKGYTISKPLFEEIYDEVSSGNEIRSVIINGKREMGEISNSRMWRGCKNRKSLKSVEDPRTAGLYIGCMMSQIDILLANNHNYSEIVNESIIEAVDSLNPYMLEKGISHMIDNCSTTARLGARKWASRLDYLLEQNMNGDYESKIGEFVNHPIHDIFKEIRVL